MNAPARPRSHPPTFLASGTAEPERAAAGTVRSPAHDYAVSWLVRALKDLHQDVMGARARWEELEREGRREEAGAARAAAQAHGKTLHSILAAARDLAKDGAPARAPGP